MMKKQTNSLHVNNKLTYMYISQLQHLFLTKWVSVKATYFFPQKIKNLKIIQNMKTDISQPLNVTRSSLTTDSLM